VTSAASQLRGSMDLVDYVRELTENHQHREHYQIEHRGTWYGRDHVTTVPPLITQLWTSDVPSNADAGGGARPGFASTPTARIDAMDTAVRIDIGAHRWVTDLGEPARSLDTVALVRQLHGLSASAHRCHRSAPLRDKATKQVCCTQHAIELDVRSWWTQAQIVTGWQSPPWRPDATCPACGERGTVRIRLVEQIGMCTNDACRSTWDHATIGLLAEHIRAESDAARLPVTRRGPCWCPVPEPKIPDLSVLCPACGSARCIHAVTARLVTVVRESVEDERMGA
jgi:hypothetical protein